MGRPEAPRHTARRRHTKRCVRPGRARASTYRSS